MEPNQSFHSLKKEAQLRLTEIRPTTFGQAARIQGVTPAEISLIAVMLRKAGEAEMNDA
jgi:tRNA uridine 5-carboxymethylaminomethyl modification enzyme